MSIVATKQASLFSAIAIGVGSIVGSGWLFASYYSAKYAGPIAIFSWVIGAAVALMLALLLAEIATIYQENGLFSRLLTITHNRDFGFIVAISNWFIMVAVAPSEATATVQYLGHVIPWIEEKMFVHDNLNALGMVIVCGVMSIYALLNYWGIKTLARANNVITTIKMIVPAAIGILFLCAQFHPGNFTSYKGTIAPYGIGRIFTSIVDCGIFYAFYGFSMVTVFAKELKNPKRNLPLALIGSVLTCLVIYLILQVSFIGAMDPAFIATHGWHALNFQSPLANLAVLLGMNWLALLLYVDASISPSGTGILYTGSGTRMLNAMADDGQMPKIFAKMNQQFFISRTSLIFTILLSFVLIIFFNNWQRIMVVVTTFELISCLAIPLAFTALRRNEANKERLFTLPYGKAISVTAYLVVTYLLTQCGLNTMLLALACHITFFIIYCIVYYEFKPKLMLRAFYSSWTMFAYLLMICIFAWFGDRNLLVDWIAAIFVIVALIFYVLLLGQKNFSEVTRKQ